MPLEIALSLGKPEGFDGMLVRVLEVEGLDAILVPIRKALRRGRSEFDLVLTEDRVGAVHVADNNGDVLKPKIIAARIHRNRPASRSEKLRQLNRLITEFHFNQSH